MSDKVLRKCSKCKQKQGLDEFYLDGAWRKRSECRTCEQSAKRAKAATKKPPPKVRNPEGKLCGCHPNIRAEGHVLDDDLRCRVKGHDNCNAGADLRLRAMGGK